MSEKDIKGLTINKLYEKLKIIEQDFDKLTKEYEDEIERYWQENNNLKEDFKRHIDRINELTNRIDKAIEYIEDNVSVYAFNNKRLPHWEMNDDEINKLLDILKGE